MDSIERQVVAVEDDLRIARRRMLLGAGATALVAASLRGTDLAEAKPRPDPRDPLAPRTAGPSARTAAVTPSKPFSGKTYRSVSYWDFHTLEAGSQRSIGNLGMYENLAFAMAATLDIPIGAVVSDVEFYLSNTDAGDNVGVSARVWSPGVAPFDELDLVFGQYGASAGIQVRRLVVPDPVPGPVPAGAKLVLLFGGNGSSKQQINGARVAFVGAGAINMRPDPVRVYDSRVQGGILTGGTTRAVTFDDVQAPRGTVAAIVNLTALGATANGYLKAYATDANPVPTISSLNFTASGAAIANGAVVGVSAARQLTVYANKTCHFIVDLLGTVS